jgi:hypothetical protein
MKLFSCKQHEEVTAALGDGRWPAGCSAALQAHVADCQECSDLVLVAETLRQARSETMHEAVLVPALLSPETLWWRSEMRLKSEAIERMSKPLAVAEKLGLATIPLALLGLIVWQWRPISGWLTDASNLFHSSDPAAAIPGTAEVISLMLIVGLGGLILISMLALFLLTEKE